MRKTTEEYSHPTIHVRLHDLVQDLGPGAVDARDAVDVEDDVLVMLGRPDARESGMRSIRSVEFQAAETILEITGVGEGEGLRDLDDQGTFDEFHFLRVKLRVLELIVRSGDLAQDLYPGLRGVTDEDQYRQANAKCDSEFEGIEDRRQEDENHQAQLPPAAQSDKEFQVVRAFFDQGIGDNGYHRAENGFLGAVSRETGVEKTPGLTGR